MSDKIVDEKLKQVRHDAALKDQQDRCKAAGDCPYMRPLDQTCARVCRRGRDSVKHPFRYPEQMAAELRGK